MGTVPLGAQRDCPLLWIKQYSVNKLVYFESTALPYDALSREKQLKNWHRDWKIALIEKENSGWEDLSYKVFV